MRKARFFLAALAVCSFSLSFAQQPNKPTPAPGVVNPPPREDQTPAVSPVMLLDRVAQLEAAVRAIDQRIDDSRNLTLTLFGGLIAILAAIGVPIIFRERRDVRELRERATLEQDKITAQLRAALEQIESQIAGVREKLNSETETLRAGLIENVRAQMVSMQQQAELSITAQKSQILNTAPPEVARLAMQRLEAQLEKYSAALRGLNAPPLPTDYVLRASFYLARPGDENAGAAVREARRALELDPENLDALLALSQGLARIGEDEEALAHLTRANEIAPNDSRVLEGLVSAALKSQEYEQALKYSKQLQRRADFENQSWLATVQAAALRRLGRSREAMQVLRGHLQDEPHESQVRRELIETQLDADLFEEADRTASEGLTVNPSDIQLMVLRARARAGAGQYQGAFDDLAAAEQRNPRDVKIYITKSRIFYMRHEYEQAVLACQAGLALRPPEGFRALLYVNLAEALLRLNRMSEALDAADQSVRLGRGYVLNHLVLVQTLFCANRLSDAVLAANEATAVARTPWAAALLRLFAALSALGLHGPTSAAEKAALEFETAVAGVQVKWDLAFIRSCINARTDSEVVRNRMLALLDIAEHAA